MKKEKISDAVIRRLPRYYRYLDELHAKGIVRISSGSLGKRMGVTASQIRQDLSCFGEFGQQGYGYNVAELRADIDGVPFTPPTDREIIDTAVEHLDLMCADKPAAVAVREARKLIAYYIHGFPGAAAARGAINAAETAEEVKAILYGLL